jgi:uncharacterized protein (TIGR03086 family)
MTFELMAEVADRYAAVAADFTARVRGVGGHWSAPSPCEGWTARDVVAHVISSHRAALAEVEDPGSEEGPVGNHGDITAAWHSASEALNAALADPSKASRVIANPLGDMPFEALVGRLLCADTVIHTWDLARATGQDERLDAAAVEAAFDLLLPLDGQVRQPGLFGPEIEPPPGADRQTELLCFLGRRV